MASVKQARIKRYRMRSREINVESVNQNLQKQGRTQWITAK